MKVTFLLVVPIVSRMTGFKILSKDLFLIPNNISVKKESEAIENVVHQNNEGITGDFRRRGHVEATL